MADKILIEVVLTKADTKKAFNEVEQKAAVAGAKTGRSFGKSFSTSVKASASSAAKSFAAITVAALGLNKALQLIGSSFENLRGFSRGVAEINSILPKNQKLTKEATQNLVEYAAAFGTKQTEQARGFYNIVSAGVKGTSKQLKTLSIANKAAVAGLVDIDSAAKVLVSSVNAYAVSGLTAQEASDSLFVAVREGQTTFGELANFLGNVTSVAASAGLEFDELSGFLAFATKNGLATDVAVTGLRQILSTLIKPAKEAADAAAQMGLEFNTAALKSKGLGGFLTDLIKKTKGSEVELGKLFGNVKALTPILQVAGGNFQELERILAETKNSAGATGTAFKIIAQNIDFKLDAVTAEFSALGLNLLRVVNPAILTFADGLKIIGKFANSAFKEDSSKPIDVLQKRLKSVNTEIKSSESLIKSFDGKMLKTLFGGESVNGKNFRLAKLALVDLQQKRKDILAERAVVIDANKKLDDERLKKEKDTNAGIIASRQTSFSALAALGVKSIGTIVEAENAKIAQLDSLNQQKLVTEADYAMALIQIRSATDIELDNLERNRVESAINASGSISDAFIQSAKSTKVTAIQIGKTMNTLAQRGFGDAFKKIGAAIANGENINQAFVDSAKATASEAASAFGDFYIKKGVVQIADGDPRGYGVLAGGAGLKLLAGVLGASGGGSAGGGGSSSGGGAGGGGSLDETGALEEQEVERAAPSTNVEIVVQGSLVQQEELGEFITETLNESFGKQSVALTDARFA